MLPVEIRELAMTSPIFVHRIIYSGARSRRVSKSPRQTWGLRRVQTPTTSLPDTQHHDFMPLLMHRAGQGMAQVQDAVQEWGSSTRLRIRVWEGTREYPARDNTPADVRP